MPNLKEVNISVAKGKYQKWLEPEGLTLLTGWARNGLTDEQIAHNIGINKTTLYDWIKKYPDISNSLKKGKEVVDIEVENALLKKAIGYNAEVNKTFKIKEVYYDKKNRRCEKEKLVTAVDEVHIPADTIAQIFWLKNRRPDKWRDKVQEDNSNASDSVININISPAELNKKTGEEQ